MQKFEKGSIEDLKENITLIKVLVKWDGETYLTGVQDPDKDFVETGMFRPELQPIQIIDEDEKGVFSFSMFNITSLYTDEIRKLLKDGVFEKNGIFYTVVK